LTFVQNFVFGRLEHMDYPALKWWNSKRLEYNYKFICCLLLAQFLFLGASLSLGITNEHNWFQRLIGALVADLVIIFLANVGFFIWPIMERFAFKRKRVAYRKACYAFANITSALLPLGAALLILRLKA